MDTVICKEVIITTLTRRGNGKDIPIRVITEYWDKGGNKLAENDSYDVKEEIRKLIQVAPNGSDIVGLITEILNR